MPSRDIPNELGGAAATRVGEDEVGALTDLVIKLREFARPGRIAERWARALLAYLVDAEAQPRDDDHSSRSAWRG